MEAWLRLGAQFVEWQEWPKPPYPYDVDPNWERQLYVSLGVSWPCDVRAELLGLRNTGSQFGRRATSRGSKLNNFAVPR